MIDVGDANLFWGRGWESGGGGTWGASGLTSGVLETAGDGSAAFGFGLKKLMIDMVVGDGYVCVSRGVCVCIIERGRYYSLTDSSVFRANRFFFYLYSLGGAPARENNIARPRF